MTVAIDGGASNVRAILCMIAGQASFTINDTLIKLATTDLPGGQAIFVRGLVATVFALTACAALGVLSF